MLDYNITMIKFPIKYTINKKFTISNYSDIEILEVIKNDFKLHQKGIVNIENSKLIYIGTDKQPFFFSPLDRELYAIDKAEINIEKNSGRRKIVLRINSKRLDRYNTNGLAFMFVFIIFMAFLTKSWNGFIIPIVFLSGFLILVYFFGRLRFYSMIKRIMIREELRINNML